MWDLAFFFAELFWVKENERMKKNTNQRNMS